MSLFKPDPPTPPNPIATAAASTSTNVATGVANAFLNNTNQVTPNGTLSYNATGTYGWTDPVTNQTYQIPRFTATQTLTPQGQAIQDQNQAAQYNLAGMANAQSGKIAQHLATPLDTSGAPARGDASTISGVPRAQTSFNPGGPIQTSLGNVGDITKTYGAGDFSADRQHVEDALMARMNPQLQLERQSIEQRLADQGIRYGSAAYTHAMDDYNRQSNDARFAAVDQAGQEQARMMQMDNTRANFENAAQEQGYNQQLGEAGLNNAAVGQQFQQNAAEGTFNNAGLAQQIAQAQSAFNAANAGRNQYMQEAYATRNQPINEITSLLSGSQVSMPNFINTPGSQIATTDTAGLINQNFNQQMGNYTAQNQNWQQLMGGVLGLGAGALKLSDEREKKDIDQVGTVFAYDQDSERQELPIYKYEYKDDPMSTQHIGPMAQDIKKLDPRAVTNVRTPAGKTRMAIDTRKVMGNILRAA
jgi:hypothetical protein